MIKTPNALRFSTKAEAEKAATGKYGGFVAVFVSDHYAPAHGLPTGGWYLIYSHGREQRIAVK